MTSPDASEPVAIRAEGDRSVAVAQATNAVIATGDHNVILNAGSDNGILLDLLRAAQRPAQQLRPVPIRSCPPAFGDRLDRDAENAAVVETLNAGGSMNLYGATGIGKTYIVREAANDQGVRARPEGIVYLNAKRLPLEDVLQALFEEFFDCNPPYKPSGSSLRHDLRDRQAIVVVDACELERDDVQELVSTLSGCAVLVGSREQIIWEGTPCFVKGLASEDALTLVERELSRSLSGLDLEAARIMCSSLDGHPLRIKQVVAPVREGRMNLEDVARALANAVSPDAEGMRIALQDTSDAERELLTIVASVNGASVGNEHLAELTGSDPTSTIERLEHRSLVAVHSPRTSFLGFVPADLESLWDIRAQRERLLEHFTVWAEAARDRRQDGRALHLAEADALLDTLRWAVADRRYTETIRLGRAIEGSFCLARRWGIWHEVLVSVNDAAVRVGDRAAQAWSLHQLGTRDFAVGRPNEAVDQLERALEIRNEIDDAQGVAATRHNLDVIASAGDPSSPRRTRRGLRALPPLALIIILVALVAAVGIYVATASSNGDNTPPPTAVELVVQRTGDGGGTITSDPDGITCGEVCAAKFSASGQISLAAIADENSVFTGWGGGCSGTANCALTLTRPANVSANFDPKPPPPTPTVTLTVIASGSGRGVVASDPAGINCGKTCRADFAQGSRITLSATADEGFVFTSWSGSCTGTAPCTITLDRATSVTADFAPSATLTIRRDGNGTVHSDPAGIDCGATCEVAFAQGTDVTLTAQGGRDSFFAGWNRPCSGTESCRLTLKQNTTVSAVFTQYPTLNLTVTGDKGAGLVTSAPSGISCSASCTAAFPPGTAVTLTVSATSDPIGVVWGGACSGGSLTCVVKLAGPSTAVRAQIYVAPD
jgi:hypothetical protein